MAIVIIAIIVLIILFIFKYKDAKHFIQEVINFFSGTVGSGKTLLAVTKLMFDFKWHQFLHWLHIAKYEPRIYSNIPLYVDKKTDVYILKREHLLCKEFFPENVCPFVLIDEISLIASCYGWDDPNFTSENLNENIETLDTFIRFFRHFYGKNNKDACRLYITDQASGSVAVGIRRRISFVNFLYHRHRWLGITPWMIIQTKEMIMEEDTVNTNNTDVAIDEQQYFMFYLPYRWWKKLTRKKPNYDSHCFYELRRTHKAVSSLPYDVWPKDSLTSSYVPDVRMNRDERKAFNKLKKELNVDSQKKLVSFS